MRIEGRRRWIAAAAFAGATVVAAAAIAGALAAGGCRGPNGTSTAAGGAPGDAAKSRAATVTTVPRLDLDAAGLLAEGTIWPHPGAPPRELPERERIVDGALVLKDGEALVLQTAGRLSGRGRVVVDARDGEGTLRVFALWLLFDPLQTTRGKPAEFQGRLGTLLRTSQIRGGASSQPALRPPAPGPDDEFENDPAGIGFLATLESPLRGELRIARVRFDELVPDGPMRHMVGGETRPAVPVAAGSTRRFELPAAPIGATVELALALPDRMTRDHAPLRATVRVEGSPASPFERRWDERDARTPPRRFDDVVFPLPEGTRERTVVEVTVEAALPDGSPAAALVALPRLLERRDAATPWNVLLLSIDTMRADRLDDERALTPQLSRFARESVRFTRCYSPANFTVPAHASMMTGLQPVVHGACRSGERVSIRAWPSLAGQLAAAGAYVAGFSGGGLVDPAFGFDERFDRYSTLDPLMSPQNPRYESGPRRHAAESNRALRESMSFARVADWAAAHADRRFFLFLHTYFAHDYWPSPDRVRRLGSEPAGAWPRPLDLKAEEFPSVTAGSEQLRWYRTLYDAAVNEVDASLETLFTRLRDSGLLETTVVVVTADHGEAFREHDSLFHSTGLHDEVLHVPLMIRVPGLPPATIDAPVSLIDLAPTVLDLVGAEPLHEIQGVSLAPLIRGGDAPDRLLLSQDFPPARMAADGARIEVDHSALIAGRFKLIRTIGDERIVESLYDLAADPHETRDVAADPANAWALASARAALDRVLAAMRVAASRAQARIEEAPMNDALANDLHKLGY